MGEPSLADVSWIRFADVVASIRNTSICFISTGGRGIFFWHVTARESPCLAGSEKIALLSSALSNFDNRDGYLNDIPQVVFVYSRREVLGDGVFVGCVTVCVVG